MIIKPVDDKVVVKVIKEAETQTSSGFIIPGNSDDKPDEAIVVAVGPGLMLDNGVLMKPDVKVGDKVLFAKYSGTEFDGHLVLAYRDIFAVLGGSDD